MPYEGWNNIKPNVSNLREFGAPVWILLQGQKEERKMLPKSKRRVYIGYKDGVKAVKYYNVATCNILTSRNFRHINPSEKPSSQEEIEVIPDTTCEPDMTREPHTTHEGESTGSTPSGHDVPTHNLGPKKRMRNETEEDIDINEPQKMCGICTDYKRLQDPFMKEDEEDENTFLSIEEVYTIVAGDEITSLNEVRNSPKWPKWQQALNEEMDLLNEMGTWELVQKPPNTIPIANKWVFVKKRNKEGEVIRFQARLVAKGCTQFPGYDYMETYSPVVRMDTLRAILALVPLKKLRLQQMDVKGAYLNGILKEIIFMQQAEGCEDRTGRVCCLVKTLYGLKQAGREWNKQLDEKLKSYGYKRLLTDPCVYIRREGEDFGIIAIWVDDSLLFASSDKMMAHMKETLQSAWQVTDLGEPSKIVGIEINRTKDAITISQQSYIENILQREGMSEANPVGIPMDPNIKLQENPDANEPN
jgi:hypothetical protein